MWFTGIGQAGRVSGKGSHRNYKHPKGVNITISGKPGSDAKPYQEADVKKALERIKYEKK